MSDATDRQEDPGERRSLEQDAKPCASFIECVWTGKWGLARTYWIVAVLLGFVALGVLIVAGNILGRVFELGDSAVFKLSALGYAAYLIWSGVGVWRAADNYKGPVWGTAARIAVVVGAIAFASSFNKTLDELEQRDWARHDSPMLAEYRAAFPPAATPAPPQELKDPPPAATPARPSLTKTERTRMRASVQTLGVPSLPGVLEDKQAPWVASARAAVSGIRNIYGDPAVFVSEIDYEARRAGVDPILMLAIIEVAKGFRQPIDFEHGARGYMLVSPIWLQEIGATDHDLLDQRTNLRYGATILRHYLDKYQGDAFHAMRAYGNQISGWPEDSDVAPVFQSRVADVLRSRWQQ